MIVKNALVLSSVLTLVRLCIAVVIGTIRDIDLVCHVLSLFEQ